MENRALQERILEDVIFSLAKNQEQFSFEKLAGLFPAVEIGFIKKRFSLAKENLGLLDEIVSDTLQKANNDQSGDIIDDNLSQEETSNVQEKPAKPRVRNSL